MFENAKSLWVVGQSFNPSYLNLTNEVFVVLFFLVSPGQSDQLTAAPSAYVKRDYVTWWDGCMEMPEYIAFIKQTVTSAVIGLIHTCVLGCLLPLYLFLRSPFAAPLE